MARIGASQARRTISTPTFSSSDAVFTLSSAPTASMRAAPPPAMMPSSTAACVACKASSMRLLVSFSSASVAAPTLMTATPPDSFALRSLSLSRSKSLVVSSIWASICLMRSSMSAFLPAPSTMVVASLVTLMDLAVPSISTLASASDTPSSSMMGCAPVKTAISSSMRLRRSPKPGAFTATTLRMPRMRFSTRVASASPSTSSAMISSDLEFCMMLSSSGRMS